LFLKIRTKIITSAAQLAVFNRLPPAITFANVAFRAIRTMKTGVVTGCSVAGLFDISILPEFSGNGGTVFAESFCNLPKG
jgi:hypothetical protein